MRAFPLAAALAVCAATAAHAQDALRGKLLYHDLGRVSGAGVSCVDCHGGYPGALHGIGKAASGPGAVAYAIGAIAAMEPLRGRLSPADMADIAAYLAWPAVPSPDLRLTATGPAASPYSALRLEFPPAQSGTVSPPSTVRLVNLGAVPVRLGSAPVLAGAAAAEFAIAGTGCAAGMTLAAGQSCAIDVLFRPAGAAGLRSASVGVAHDWIGGGTHVALIGAVAPTRRSGRGVSSSSSEPAHTRQRMPAR